MNQKSLFPVLAAAGVGLWAAFVGQPSAVGQNSDASQIQIKVSCETIDGTPTTVLSGAKEGKTVKIQLIHWKAEVFPTSANPQQFCQDASAKLERAYSHQKDGKLDYVTRMVGGKPSLCVEKTQNEGCDDSNLLFSLEKSKTLSEVETISADIIDSRIKKEAPIFLRDPDGSSRQNTTLGEYLRTIFW